MRDKQARGKNPYSEESDASDAEPMRLGGRYVQPLSLTSKLTSLIVTSPNHTWKGNAEEKPCSFLTIQKLSWHTHKPMAT